MTVREAWRLQVRTLLRPQPTFERLALEPLRAGFPPVLLLGAGYALFSAWLAARGLSPSRTLVALEPYYGFQAAFVLPLFVVAWLALVATTHRLAKAFGGRGAAGGTAAALGHAYAVPLTWLFLAPDIVVFALAGMDGLRAGMRYYAPLAPLVVLALTVLAVRRVHGLSWPRSAAAAVAGLVVQAVVVAPLLR